MVGEVFLQGFPELLEPLKKSLPERCVVDGEIIDAEIVDGQGRVIGASGKRPVLRNVTAGEIAAFRAQVQVVDMIGHERPDELVAKIEELAARDVPSCGCSACAGVSPLPISTTPAIAASGLDAVYVPFHVTAEQLCDAVAGVRAMEIRGINLTIPHKEAACHLVE